MSINLLRWPPEVDGLMSEQSTGGPGLLPQQGTYCVNTSGGKSPACLLKTLSVVSFDHLREYLVK